MKTLFRIFLTLIIPTSGLAQNSNAPTPVAAKAVFHADGHLYFEVADGRVAQYRGRTLGPMPIRTTLKMTENLCQTESLQSDCKAIASLIGIEGVLVWVQNPDPARLYQPVLSYENELVSRLYFKQDHENNPTALICDQYRWLNGNTPGLARFRIIDSWGKEANASNSETGLNENLTQSGAINVTAAPAYGAYYLLKPEMNAFMNILVGNFLVTSGPLSLVMTSPISHETCQIQFMSDASEVQTKALAYAAKLKSKPYSEMKFDHHFIKSIQNDLNDYYRMGVFQ